ncbi:MAG: anaerobic ribonucleoside-triphosphate reductase activating protein [Candidatus Omnitrophica bacterium]|nr:anaerobic ribonucleoside-triphosphate reductase activating protein [Candidatus Omnitrophota bacterium]
MTKLPVRRQRVNIAGLQNLSLVDYPGHLSAAVFVNGCNFRCGYCQNPDLLGNGFKYSITEQEIFDYIEKRKGQIEGVVVSGGEPTIYRDLPDFISRIKRYGLKVKLDTNGADPEMLEKLFRDHLLDYVAIDIKTGLGKYGMVTDMPYAGSKVSLSIWMTMLSTVDHEFRTTCVPGLVEEEDIREIAETVTGAGKYFLQQFRPYNTLEEEYLRVKPYTKKELENFASIMNVCVENVEIRGV